MPKLDPAAKGQIGIFCMTCIEQFQIARLFGLYFLDSLLKDGKTCKIL
jgi:hypothetical protein